MKLCTVCGVLTSRPGSRCTTHERQSNRSRHKYNTRAWQRLSARVLRTWRGEHGNWCPGYQRPAHAAADLTVDHVVPLAAGGAPFDIANLAVLCRSCNSTKGPSEADRGYPHAGSVPLEDRELRAALIALDQSAWADIRGREVTPHYLGKLLRAFGIESKRNRPSGVGNPVHGYFRASFRDAWERYSPPLGQSGTTGTTGTMNGAGPRSGTRPVPNVPDVPDTGTLTLDEQRLVAAAAFRIFGDEDDWILGLA